MKKARNETAGHMNSSLMLCAGTVWRLEDSPYGLMFAQVGPS